MLIIIFFIGIASCVLIRFIYRKLLKMQTLNWPAMAVYGHRGAITHNIIENRIPAFQFAINHKAFGIELDTRVTKDGHIVVFHDSTIRNHITHEFLSIKSNSLSTLYNVSSPKIQTLGEIFNWIKTTTTPNYPMNIEIKLTDENNKRIQEIAKLLIKTIQNYRHDLYNITIQSFNSDILREIQAITDQPAISLLVETPEEIQHAIEIVADKSLTIDIISPHFSLVTSNLVQEFHKNNIKILPWTVNSFNIFTKMKKIGVDGIITDYPNIFSETT